MTSHQSICCSKFDTRGSSTELDRWRWEIIQDIDEDCTWISWSIGLCKIPESDITWNLMWIHAVGKKSDVICYENCYDRVTNADETDTAISCFLRTVSLDKVRSYQVPYGMPGDYQHRTSGRLWTYKRHPTPHLAVLYIGCWISYVNILKKIDHVMKRKWIELDTSRC